MVCVCARVLVCVPFSVISSSKMFAVLTHCKLNLQATFARSLSSPLSTNKQLTIASAFHHYYIASDNERSRVMFYIHVYIISLVAAAAAAATDSASACLRMLFTFLCFSVLCGAVTHTQRIHCLVEHVYALLLVVVVTNRNILSSGSGGGGECGGRIFVM